GAGGLSIGFQQTKKYDIKVAFESNPIMQETYRKNHPGVEVCGDVCGANYSAIEKKYGSIDVVIGGPPCQGFSNANRQKKKPCNKSKQFPCKAIYSHNSGIKTKGFCYGKCEYASLRRSQILSM
ncbi:DNA cytosine methyltransferase, partial [Eubacterium aggregans]|uniref:DNA cytosine methyltransferase n=1 Tax=Eubacterium aggregans TaxID=81409 RepID=UPI003F3A825F